jgi:hypothetical protein
MIKFQSIRDRPSVQLVDRAVRRVFPASHPDDTMTPLTLAGSVHYPAWSGVTAISDCPEVVGDLVASCRVTSGMALPVGHELSPHRSRSGDGSARADGRESTTALADAGGIGRLKVGCAPVPTYVFLRFSFAVRSASARVDLRFLSTAALAKHGRIIAQGSAS